MVPEKELRGIENKDASNLGVGLSAESSNREVDGWVDFFVASLKQGVSQIFQVHWYNGKLGDLFGDVKENGVTRI